MTSIFTRKGYATAVSGKAANGCPVRSAKPPDNMEFHFISPCGAKLCEAVDTLAEEKRMLMKILIGKFGHEANTFASHHEQFEPYAASGSLCRGEAIIPTFRGTPDYIGGMIDAAEEAGAALIPTIACLTAAPTLTSGCARRVSDELIDAAGTRTKSTASAWACTAPAARRARMIWRERSLSGCAKWSGQKCR